MKKKCLVWLTVFLTAVITWNTPLETKAAETVLTTTVPTEVSIKIEIGGLGRVVANGANCYNGSTITVARNTDVQYSILPSNGYRVLSISYNDIQVEGELEDNVMVICAENNATLQIEFVPVSQGPQTGDCSNLFYIRAAMVLSSATVAGSIIYSNNRKKEQL